MLKILLRKKMVVFLLKKKMMTRFPYRKLITERQIKLKTTERKILDFISYRRIWILFPKLKFLMSWSMP